MNHVNQPLSSAEVSFFFIEKTVNFAISRNSDIDCISVHNF